jgi:hypothetical protein
MDQGKADQGARDGTESAKNDGTPFNLYSHEQDDEKGHGHANLKCRILMVIQLSFKILNLPLGP